MDKMLIWPLIAQIWLTITVAILTLNARVRAYAQGEVKAVYFKHNRGKAPDSMLRWGDNLKNQFELPVLFYLLVVLLLITEQNSLAYAILAWVFVMSRLVHSFIHIKTNHILHRRNSFMIGVLALVLMWMVFTMQMLIQ